VTEQSAWIVPMYLGARATPVPSYEDVGLSSTIDAATICFDLRSDGLFLGTRFMAGGLAENPWREICGLVGSIGESLVLAAACGVEAEAHKRAIASGGEPNGMVIAQRFFSNAQGQEVISVGHRLANVAIRTLAIDPDLRARMDTCGHPARGWAKAHAPNSSARRAWLSLNKATADALRCVVTQTRHCAIFDVAEEVALLQHSDEWRELDDVRGESHHRWRAESSVVTGLDEESGYIQELRDQAGDVVGEAMLAEPAAYKRGVGLEARDSEVARRALRAVTERIAPFITAVRAAAEPITRGRLNLTGGVSNRLGAVWDDDTCGCCPVHH
jgi:hypothetical protein